jgi:hypothetical protein
MHELTNWKARRSGAGITVVTEGGEKHGVDVIEPRDGKVIATRFKPLDIGSNEGRQIDEEFELIV